jgi:hypothetical protein
MAAHSRAARAKQFPESYFGAAVVVSAAFLDFLLVFFVVLLLLVVLVLVLVVVVVVALAAGVAAGAAAGAAACANESVAPNTMANAIVSSFFMSLLQVEVSFFKALNFVANYCGGIVRESSWK